MPEQINLLQIRKSKTLAQMSTEFLAVFDNIASRIFAQEIVSRTNIYTLSFPINKRRVGSRTYVAHRPNIIGTEHLGILHLRLACMSERVFDFLKDRCLSVTAFCVFCAAKVLLFLALWTVWLHDLYTSSLDMY